MGRPLTFLIFAIAIACVALYMLLPLSKLALHSAAIETTEPAPLPQSTDTPMLGSSRPALSTATEAVVETVDTDAAARQTVAVSGHVSNDSGAPLAGLDIALESKGFDGEKVATARVVSDQYGGFTLQLVPARQYKISIAAGGDYAGFTLDGFTDSDAERLQNIVLERVELVDVDGLIVDTDLAPVADFELNLRHLTLEYPDRIIRSDSSGYFSVKGFPAGEVRISTNKSDYYYIKGLELRPGEYRNLTLMIDRGSYHLSGWVHDTNGAPLAEIIVTLKSAFATDEYHSFSYRSVTTDSNGVFEFSGLGGHQLTLGVYGAGFRTQIRKYDFQSFSDTLEIVLER
jgi:hypothetical protein